MKGYNRRNLFESCVCPHDPLAYFFVWKRESHSYIPGYSKNGCLEKCLLNVWIDYHIFLPNASGKNLPFKFLFRAGSCAKRHFSWPNLAAYLLTNKGEWMPKIWWQLRQGIELNDMCYIRKWGSLARTWQWCDVKQSIFVYRSYTP